MSGTALETVLRRDRAIVAVAMAAITIVSWTYVLWLAAGMSMPDPHAGMDMSGMDMSGMDMSGMDMGAVSTSSFRSWMPADFLFIFTMWAIMMIGMMTPSVSPMILLYALVGRKARADGHPFASAAWFLAGYFLVWTGFSIAATAAQWLLASLALLTPMMAASSTILGGVILIAAGIYQWTPAKAVCLRQCQVPMAFLSRHGGFRSDALGAVRLGIAHGTYCLGCCWALMALLFVGGVMNVLWIAGLAILVLLEKTIPQGRLIPRIAGALMVVAGAWFITRAG